MNERELRLAASLLRMASDEFSNHGCNDFVLPESWTQEQCDEFTQKMADWSGDQEGHNPGARWTDDWFVMSYLAAMLNKAADEMSASGIA